MNITVFLGSLLLDEKFVNELLFVKVQELRMQLKNEYDVDLSEIQIMDNLQIGKKDVFLVIDNNIIWKQDFADEDFDVIADIIIGKLKASQIQK